jgi:hypothetical protein
MRDERRRTVFANGREADLVENVNQLKSVRA